MDKENIDKDNLEEKQENVEGQKIQEDKKFDYDNSKGNYMSMGMCLGMCFGMVFGQLFFDNLIMGVSLGMCFGLAIGSGIKKRT